MTKTKFMVLGGISTLLLLVAVIAFASWSASAKNGSSPQATNVKAVDKDAETNDDGASGNNIDATDVNENDAKDGPDTGED